MLNKDEIKEFKDKFVTSSAFGEIMEYLAGDFKITRFWGIFWFVVYYYLLITFLSFKK